MKRDAPGRTKPRPADIAMFDGFTEQQIMLFLAAAREALRRKQAGKRLTPAADAVA